MYFHQTIHESSYDTPELNTTFSKLFFLLIQLLNASLTPSSGYKMYTTLGPRFQLRKI